MIQQQDSAYLWAKTAPYPGKPERWHPLLLHLLDVAAAADAILEREPASTRERVGAVLGLAWRDARPWLLFVVACHDLGKACPSFQSLWPDQLAASGLPLPKLPTRHVRHNFVSQVVLTDVLAGLGWPPDLAAHVADAVGCHHGERASLGARADAELEVRRIGTTDLRSRWAAARAAVHSALLEVFQPGAVPAKADLTGPDFMLLAGLTSFADWIGSNEDWFTFGSPEDCEHPSVWYERRMRIAAGALDAINWKARTPLIESRGTFEDLIGHAPRPLQAATAKVIAELIDPPVILIEAPMGEGKTEAAFYAHSELQRRFGHRGMYVALPTQATGNAMFKRAITFLGRFSEHRELDLQLLHGAKSLSDDFQRLRHSRIGEDSDDGGVTAAEWFTHKKRALLSEYGVGTVDQALLPILPVRHQFVRLWGLANRVVILDEIHAYDAYTGTLLRHLVSWLQALGSSVILLSATLPPAIRRTLAQATRSRLPDPEAPYPRISVFVHGEPVRQYAFPADSARRVPVRLEELSPSPAEMNQAMSTALKQGGYGLQLVNTVQRAQQLYQLYPPGEPLLEGGVIVGKNLPDGTRVFLFHARFPASERQARELAVLNAFGSPGPRSGRAILIATQVAEQSLDLDFDVMATDLAPIDLVLQRAGRLWRHARADRALSSATLFVAGLCGEEPTAFGSPLWWNKVYDESLLLRTWALLKPREELAFPDDIERLVNAVYDEIVPVPEWLRPRLDEADGDAGKALAQRQQAHAAIIGMPDDASWDDPNRYVLYDDDAAGVHRTLMARTRLGEESITVVPLRPVDQFDPMLMPEGAQAKEWFLRSMTVSRPWIVKKLVTEGVPEGWRRSPLLRTCYPMLFDGAGQWLADSRVYLNAELGLTYANKAEAE